MPFLQLLQLVAEILAEIRGAPGEFSPSQQGQITRVMSTSGRRLRPGSGEWQ